MFLRHIEGPHSCGLRHIANATKGFLCGLSKCGRRARLLIGAERGATGRSYAMQYLMMIHLDEAAMAAARQSDAQAISAAYGAYTEAMRQADVLRGGERLHPAASGAIVRNKGGKTSVVNGPYAEAKEQLGGYYVIEAADLDAAIAWAARCPGAAMGAIEVRPIWPM